MDKVRVLRVLEYVGDRKWVEETLMRSSVPLNGIKHVDKNNQIKSSSPDIFPETINTNDIDQAGVDMVELKELVGKYKNMLNFNDKVEMNKEELSLLINALKLSYVNIH